MSPTTLYIVIWLLVLILVIFSIKIGQVSSEKEHLKLKIQRLELLSSLDRITIGIQDMKSQTPQISKRAKSLIMLSLNNANEHEASAAALKACKIISKDLGLK